MHLRSKIITILLFVPSFCSGCFSFSGSTISSQFLTLQIPGPFTINTGIPGNGKVQIFWNNSDQATSYRVSYGTSPHQYTATISNAVSPTTVQGLTNGVIYYLMITAVNSQGTTDAQSEISFTPGQPIIAPISDLNLIGTTASWTLNVPTSIIGNPSASCTSNISIMSSNSSLIASNQISTAGTYPNCTIVSSVGGNSSGTTTLNITVTYGSATASRSFILNILPPAAAAFGIRRIVGGYTGPSMLVRRSSDNALLDIGFTPTNDLDTGSLLTFLGSNSGYVNVWYDQSGSGQHAVQSTASYQPSIVSTGTIQVQNARPSINFSVASSVLTSSVNIDSSVFPQLTINTVFTDANKTGSRALWGQDNGGWKRFVLLTFAGTPYGISNGSTAQSIPGLSATAGPTILTTLEDNGLTNGSTVYLNRALALTYTDTHGVGQNTLTIGGISSPSNLPFGGYMSEFVVYGQLLSLGDRQNLELSQRTYYGTP